MRKKFLSQFDMNACEFVENVSNIIQLGSSFRFLKCDVLVANGCVFLLTKNKFLFITQYQPIIQLVFPTNNLRTFEHVHSKLIVDYFSAEGRLITINADSYISPSFELRFGLGFDAQVF